MRAEAVPNYGIRAILLILAVGALGVVLAVTSNAAGSFLTFNLSHLLGLGVILFVGGVLLLFGMFRDISALSIAKWIIGIGMVACVVSVVLGLGRLASDFLSFDLAQILVLGILFIIIGFYIHESIKDSSVIIPRRIAWTLIAVGAVFIIAALVAGSGTLLGFIPTQLLALGVLFVAVGVILLVMYQGRLEAPTPAAMAQARVTSMKATSSAPAAPRPAPAVSTQVAPPAAARSAVPSMDKKDDLTIIEGIGPKSADALYKAKIYTFRQIADLSPEDLHRIVKIEGGVNLVNDPKTWPKQAKLLAEGKRQEFEEYVKHLVNSRDPGDKK